MNIKTCKYCNISFKRPSAESCTPNDACSFCHGFFKDSDNESDPVNSPAHYQGEDGIECIDAIRAALGLEGFIAHCRATAIKYCWRAGRKGEAAEDLRKAAWYLARAAEELEKLHEPITRESDEWIPTSGQDPGLPYDTLVDCKFADGDVVIGRSADSWKWEHEGEPCDITHYRIHQPIRG